MAVAMATLLIVAVTATLLIAVVIIMDTTTVLTDTTTTVARMAMMTAVAITDMMTAVAIMDMTTAVALMDMTTTIMEGVAAVKTNETATIICLTTWKKSAQALTVGWTRVDCNRLECHATRRKTSCRTSRKLLSNPMYPTRWNRTMKSAAEPDDEERGNSNNDN